MRYHTIHSWCLAFLLILFWTASPFAQQDSATNAIRHTVNLITYVLKDPELKKSENAEKRRADALRIIRNRFDFAEMAKRSLGPHWKDLTDKERTEFIDLFTRLLEAEYADKIESYEDEKIVFKSEDSISPGIAEVRTYIVTKDDVIPVNYRCMYLEKSWKVYDVVIENVSLVNNYRSQFKEIMLNESYEGLVARLRKKTIKTGLK